MEKKVFKLKFIISMQNVPLFKRHILESWSRFTIEWYNESIINKDFIQFEVIGSENELDSFRRRWYMVLDSKYNNILNDYNIKKILTLKYNLDKRRTPPWKQQAWGRSEQSPSVNVAI